MSGRAAVRPDDVGRQFAAGRHVPGVVGRVDVGVDVPAVRSGEGADLGLGVVDGVDRVVVLGPDHPGPARAGVQFDDLVGGARAGADADDPLAVHREGGRELGPGARRVDEFAGLGVEDAERGRAAAVHHGDQAAVQGREPAVAELPECAAELLLARAELLAVAVEVPPAGAVARVQESAVG